MATPERGSLAGGTFARLEARAAQKRPSPRTDRRQALSVRRVQGEGRLDAGAWIFARGAHLRGYGAHQVALDIGSPLVSRARRKHERAYSAGAGGGCGDTGGALGAGPRSGRSSISSTAASAAIKKISAATNTNRNTDAISIPAAPAVSTRSSTPVPRSGVAPRPASRIAPMIATASVL